MTMILTMASPESNALRKQENVFMITVLRPPCPSRREGKESFKEAPFNTPVRRLDDVKAARQLDVRYEPES